MSFTKVTASNGSEYTPESVFTENGEVLGVIGQDKTPGLSVKEMQESIEAVVRKVAIPAHNALVDELSAETAAENIGAKDKNGEPSSVQERINAAVENDGTMPFVRLNADRVIETSTDGVEFEATGSSGHIIEDADGIILPQRSRLRFANGTVTDENGVTVVEALKGDTGAQGERGERGEQGERGEVGPAGPVMTPSINAAGVLSWELLDTAIPPSPVSIRGPQGPQGVAGAQGVQGVRGPAGEQGVAGPQGIAGPQGPAGVAGPAGATGATGPQGPRGPEGPAGKDGLSLYVEDIYPTVASLTAAFPSGNNSMYMVEANMHCYIWSETNNAWTSVGQLQGPKGDKGETGETGPVGPTGATGPAGPQGIQGVQGLQGEVGPQGIQGPAGAAGTDGKSAFQAAADAGYTGTETDFNAALAQVPYAGDMHKATYDPNNKAQDVYGYADNAAANAVKGYLPLSGGTINGAITIERANYPGFTLNNTTANGAMAVTEADDGVALIQNNNGSDYTALYIRPAAGGINNALQIGMGLNGGLEGAVVLHSKNYSEHIPKPKVATISVGTSWSGNGPFTQTVSVPGATANSKVDLQPDASILQGMIDLGVTALFVTNNNGVFTLTALGAAPAVSFSLQATVEEVTV